MQRYIFNRATHVGNRAFFSGQVVTVADLGGDLPQLIAAGAVSAVTETPADSLDDTQEITMPSPVE